MAKGFQRGNTVNRKHGISAVIKTKQAPAEFKSYERQLTEEIVEEAGGDPRWRHVAGSLALKEIIRLLALEFLGQDDVNLFWLEEQDGRKIVVCQPILKTLNTYLEGIRRDCDALGLTPSSRARLGLKDKDAIDYDELAKELRDHD